MKVWTKVVIEPDGTINQEDSSWEQYEGPLALAGGDDDVESPEKSPQELALLTEQTNLLKQQSSDLAEQKAFQKDLQPFLFEELGIKEDVDPETGERTFSRVDDPSRDLREDIELKQLQRTRDAFEGNLPVSPGLERELASTERSVRERLRKQLGPDFETSTPGAAVLGSLFTRSEELRESARRGELTAGTQSALALGQFNQGTLGSFLSQAGGISQGGLPFIGAGSQVSQSLGNQLGLFAQDRGLQAQIDIANADRRAASSAALLGAVGGLGGAAITGGASYLGSQALGKSLGTALKATE
jgi:hypothetical protein|tara:strand:+ start:1816 stop:2718 length:903 start_codon:yes stop_codon:yes gene_type:complete